MGKAADLLEERIQETLTFYAFPDRRAGVRHWSEDNGERIKLRTNNPLERLMKEIRRRTKVVGAFPDGKSCLNLAAARLRHIAGTEWSTRRYMNMQPLHEIELQPNGTAVA
jgi:putative transposase